MNYAKKYTVIVPKLDNGGPCNIAVDIATCMLHEGWEVRILSINTPLSRAGLENFSEVRTFSVSDIFSLQGIVHTHGLRPDILGALLRMISDRCRVLTTIHNYFEVDLSYSYEYWRVRLAWIVWSHAIRIIDRRVCVSSSMRDYYEKHMPKTMFDVVCNFCAPKSDDRVIENHEDRFLHWLAAQRIACRIVLVYVGAFSERKNILAFVQWLVRNPRTDISLVLCGSGSLREELEATIAKGETCERFLLMGNVEEPRDIVMKCDALVLPSFAEGMPLAVLEAASVGIPSLVSDIDVHRELESSGIAFTMDHLNFSDFESRIDIIAGTDIRKIVQEKWRMFYSPETGAFAYHQILKQLISCCE